MGKKNRIKKTRKNHLSVIILAGGRSARIGENKDKSQMELMGVKLIDRVYTSFISTGYFSENDIIIVGPKRKYSNYPIVVEDIYPNKGPLGGIFSGLKCSKTFYSLVVGCDMPFVEKKLIELMIEKTSKGNGDIIIPTYGNGLFEPLCAVYSKNCIEVIQNNLIKGQLSVRSIFPYLKVRMIKEEDIRKRDPELRSFFNINFKNDFEKAEIFDYKRGKKIDGT